MKIIVNDIELYDWKRGSDSLCLYSRSDTTSSYHIIIYSSLSDVYKYLCIVGNNSLMYNDIYKAFSSVEKAMDYVDFYLPKLDKLKAFL